MKIDFYQDFFDNSEFVNKSKWEPLLNKRLSELFINPPHGHFSRWLDTVSQLTNNHTSHIMLDQPSVVIGKADELSAVDRAHVETLLLSLLPWRKGPFTYFGINIDSEWRCEQKWQRVKQYIPSLKDKNILDVGCGNGYYMLRMLSQGAKSVVGVDPTLIFLAQFFALIGSVKQKLDVHFLPLRFELLPTSMNFFDVIFSMGVLYHRRDPLEHLKRLHTHMNEGGVLMLETIIIDQNNHEQLIPHQRYAGMRNVWSVPSPLLVEDWLAQCGFSNIMCHNLHPTSLDEQRATVWTKNYSLENFLDPQDASKTIEGYPAPIRAIFSAQKI